VAVSRAGAAVLDAASADASAATAANSRAMRTVWSLLFELTPAL
jgi:hypothetical protein